MSYSALLRTETRKLHEKAEASNLGGGIMDGSISLETYILHLQQQYASYRGVEKAINAFKHELPDYLQLRADGRAGNRIKTDLESRNADIPTPRNVELSNVTQAIGAMYVLEGSTMGGMMMGQSLAKCNPDLSRTTHEFYGHNPNYDREQVALVNQGKMQRWTEFKLTLDSLNLTQLEQQDLIAGADKAFAAFIN